MPWTSNDPFLAALLKLRDRNVWETCSSCDNDSYNCFVALRIKISKVAHLRRIDSQLLSFQSPCFIQCSWGWWRERLMEASVPSFPSSHSPSLCLQQILPVKLENLTAFFSRILCQMLLTARWLCVNGGTEEFFKGCQTYKCSKNVYFGKTTLYPVFLLLQNLYIFLSLNTSKVVFLCLTH